MFWVFAILIALFLTFGIIVDVQRRKRNRINTYVEKQTSQHDERAHYHMGEHRDL